MSSILVTRQILAKKAIAVASSYGWETKEYSGEMWYYNRKKCLHRDELVEAFTDLGKLFTIFYNECRPMLSIPLYANPNDMTNSLLDLIINDFGIKI